MPETTNYLDPRPPKSPFDRPAHAAPQVERIQEAAKRIVQRVVLAGMSVAELTAERELQAIFATLEAEKQQLEAENRSLEQARLEEVRHTDYWGGVAKEQTVTITNLRASLHTLREAVIQLFTHLDADLPTGQDLDYLRALVTPQGEK